MDVSVQLAFVALLSSVLALLVSPVITAWMTNRNIRAVKQEDYARQDLVAERVEEAARKLAASQASLVVSADRASSNAAAAAALAQATTERTDARAEETKAALGVIHTLVNSTLTAAKQAELNATRRLLISLKKERARTANADLIAEIDETEKRIAELQGELNQRSQAAKTVDKQQDVAQAEIEARHEKP